MITMTTIDMAATGMNITRLRINAGLSVKDLADIFGFATPQAVYKLSLIHILQRIKDKIGMFHEI